METSFCPVENSKLEDCPVENSKVFPIPTSKSSSQYNRWQPWHGYMSNSKIPLSGIKFLKDHRKLFLSVSNLLAQNLPTIYLEREKSQFSMCSPGELPPPPLLGDIKGTGFWLQWKTCSYISKPEYVSYSNVIYFASEKKVIKFFHYIKTMVVPVWILAWLWNAQWVILGQLLVWPVSQVVVKRKQAGEKLRCHPMLFGGMVA